MNTLLARSQLRFALRHPVGTLTSLVGVTVAVTAVVAVHLVGQSLRIGLETAVNPAIGGYTHVVTRAGLREADYFRLRERWRRGEPALTNVQAMVPLVDDYVMVGRDSANQEPFRLIGFEPLAGGEGRGAIPGWPTGAACRWCRYSFFGGRRGHRQWASGTGHPCRGGRDQRASRNGHGSGRRRCVVGGLAIGATIAKSRERVGRHLDSRGQRPLAVANVVGRAVARHCGRFAERCGAGARRLRRRCRTALEPVWSFCRRQRLQPWHAGHAVGIDGGFSGHPSELQQRRAPPRRAAAIAGARRIQRSIARPRCGRGAAAWQRWRGVRYRPWRRRRQGVVACHERDRGVGTAGNRA